MSAHAAATYTISPSLPSGLSLNSSTGVISGTPTAASSPLTYTVTATVSGFGSTTATLDISVIAGEDYTSGWTPADTATMRLNTGSTAAGVSTVLTNFPVLVRLNATHAQWADGAGQPDDGVVPAAAAGACDDRYAAQQRPDCADDRCRHQSGRSGRHTSRPTPRMRPSKS